MSSRISEPWYAIILNTAFNGLGHLKYGFKKTGYMILSLNLIIITFLLYYIYTPTTGILTIAVTILLMLSLHIYSTIDVFKKVKKLNSVEQEAHRKGDREPWLGNFLNIFLPGLGLIYLRNGFGFLFIAATIAIFSLELGNFFEEVLYRGMLVLSFLYSYHVAKKNFRKIDFKQLLTAVLLISIFNFTNIIYIIHFQIVDVRSYTVPTSGMSPTIESDDMILAKSIADQEEIQTGDIVVFENVYYAGEHYLNRVFAIPGDTIRIFDNALYKNGKLSTDEMQMKYGMNYLLENIDKDSTLIIPKNKYFMLGDNFHNSLDSRMYGLVDRSNIIYKPYKIYWPLDRNMSLIGK